MNKNTLLIRVIKGWLQVWQFHKTDKFYKCNILQVGQLNTSTSFCLKDSLQIQKLTSGMGWR